MTNHICIMYGIPLILMRVSLVTESDMLSAFYMWVAWLVCSSQVHRTLALSFRHTTLALLSYSWSNANEILSITTAASPTTPEPIFTTTVIATEKQMPLVATNSTPSGILPISVDLTKPSKTTTSTSTIVLNSTELMIETGTEEQVYTVFELETSKDNQGVLEFEIPTLNQTEDQNYSDIERRFILSSHPPNGTYPELEFWICHLNSSFQEVRVHKRSKNGTRLLIKQRVVTQGGKTMVKWNGVTIYFYVVNRSGTEHLEFTHKIPFEIKYCAVSKDVLLIHKSLSMTYRGLNKSEEKYIDKDPYAFKVKEKPIYQLILTNSSLMNSIRRNGLNSNQVWAVKYVKRNQPKYPEEMMRRGNSSCSTSTKGFCTTGLNVYRTSSELFHATSRYKFYHTTRDPVSFSLLSEPDDYREFFILLSPNRAKAKPSIMIHIGANKGKECIISKNEVKVVRTKCKPDWKINAYLPFWIHHYNGQIAVMSGYESIEKSQRLIYWNDPEPFNANYFGIRSLEDENIPVIVKRPSDILKLKK